LGTRGPGHDTLLELPQFVFMVPSEVAYPQQPIGRQWKETAHDLSSKKRSNRKQQDLMEAMGA
jgi:hypothetical protein